MRVIIQGIQRVTFICVVIVFVWLRNMYNFVYCMRFRIKIKLEEGKRIHHLFNTRIDALCLPEDMIVDKNPNFEFTSSYGLYTHRNCNWY